MAPSTKQTQKKKTTARKAQTGKQPPVTLSLKAASLRALSSKASGPSTRTSSIAVVPSTRVSSAALSRQASVGEEEDDTSSHIGDVLDAAGDITMMGIEDEDDDEPPDQIDVDVGDMDDDDAAQQEISKHNNIYQPS